MRSTPPPYDDEPGDIARRQQALVVTEADSNYWGCVTWEQKEIANLT